MRREERNEPDEDVAEVPAAADDEADEVEEDGSQPWAKFSSGRDPDAER